MYFQSQVCLKEKKIKFIRTFHIELCMIERAGISKKFSKYFGFFFVTITLALTRLKIGGVSGADYQS